MEIRKTSGEKNHDYMNMIQQVIGQLITLTDSRVHAIQPMKTI
jgi:hypothetical protein